MFFFMVLGNMVVFLFKMCLFCLWIIMIGMDFRLVYVFFFVLVRLGIFEGMGKKLLWFLVV